MTVYVTSQQYQSLYQSNPSDPFADFRAKLDASSATKLSTRPAHDVREEIIVTDDPALLNQQFVFDPAPILVTPDVDAP